MVELGDSTHDRMIIVGQAPVTNKRTSEGVRGAGLVMATAAIVLAGLALAQMAVWSAASIAG
jgi:hypothetical protein